MRGWPRSRRGRRWLVAAACLGVASVAVAAACGGDGDTVQGPSAEELTAWAQSLDAAGADLEEQSVSYATIVASVDQAAGKNATALKKWDKEWKKRQAAYDKEAAEVEAYNAGERQEAAANPTWTLILPPTQRSVYDLSTGKFVIVGVPGPSSRTIQGYQPQYRSLPSKPKMPKKVKVKLAHEIKRLKKLETKLISLHEQLAGLVVGSEFTSSLADLRRTVADLQAKAHRARTALKNAVKKDKKRGDVIVEKRIADLKATGLAANIAALREALLQAAQAAGVAEALTWASSGAVTSPSPAVSASPSP